MFHQQRKAEGFQNKEMQRLSQKDRNLPGAGSCDSDLEKIKAQKEEQKTMRCQAKFEVSKGMIKTEAINCLNQHLCQEFQAWWKSQNPVAKTSRRSRLN
ncbi:hypothetical protein L596_002755 [Steinernema carpocapsae]|uniref:Uncharacterized protein n=1 Tax=Steinernema carpocapsae TaxID=34508 RepID=A0A4U8UU84_STECR|nr:hypothetical protein L596_002755 [Steinernema carpocapsae]